MMTHEEPTDHEAWLRHGVLVLEDLDQPREWLVDLIRSLWPVHVDEATTLEGARSLLRVRQYGLAVVDWTLPDGPAGGLIAEIARCWPKTLVVVSTIHDDDEKVFAALRAGAQGYILKSQSEARVKSQLMGLGRGEPALSPSIAQKVLAHFRQPAVAPTDAGDELSAREVDVLRLVSKGYRNAEAAQLLGLSPQTVGSYVKAIYRKLGISNRAEAAIEATRLGLTR
ncbi:MAG: response regulator transcription factor [Burkholderiales bacterium]|nr:MAG: response regulator transcription factor [Burkholderiales bacterium]